MFPGLPLWHLYGATNAAQGAFEPLFEQVTGRDGRFPETRTTVGHTEEVASTGDGERTARRGIDDGERKAATQDTVHASAGYLG